MRLTLRDVIHATTMKSSALLVYGTLVRSLEGLGQRVGRAYCWRRSRVRMSAQTIHSSASGTAVPRHTRDAGRDGLLGTPAAAHGLGALALAAGYYATAQL